MLYFRFSSIISFALLFLTIVMISADESPEVAEDPVALPVQGGNEKTVSITKFYLMLQTHILQCVHMYIMPIIIGNSSKIFKWLTFALQNWSKAVAYARKAYAYTSRLCILQAIWNCRKIVGSSWKETKKCLVR